MNTPLPPSQLQAVSMKWGEYKMKMAESEKLGMRKVAGIVKRILSADHTDYEVKCKMVAKVLETIEM